MVEKRSSSQIIRKDGRNCFVESLGDYFAFGKMHLNFVAYDASKPVGERQTSGVSVYVDIAEVLEICRKMSSGEMRKLVKGKKDNKDSSPIFEWLGGTSATRLRGWGSPREDGMSLSRVVKLLVGSKSDFMLVADSGPGEESERGLIVPRFGKNPENHVVVSLSFEDLSELFLMTMTHYEAWLTAQYVKREFYGEEKG